MDEQISTFVAFTDGTPAQAQQYLALTDGNVEQAVELFFSNPDLGATAAHNRGVAYSTDPEIDWRYEPSDQAHVYDATRPQPEHRKHDTQT
ncbi:UBX domain protein Ubx2 [Friedmanniomyces endolithicus]|nr:UBX domain protein Ubx2 [Friedmanniomyces endolithicus]KAK0907635.1 UBX domain protein Ubx2 [Friedmanniomyces endolithicus]